MTDPSSVPSSVTTARAGSFPPAGGSRPRPFARERFMVGLVFLALVAGVIVHGAIVIYADTFRKAAGASAYRSCSEGIRELYRQYVQRLQPLAVRGAVSRSRDSVLHAELARLDESLLALRSVCHREGPRARDAYNSLTIWRYRAQDLSRLAESVLGSDAERALRYRSPNDDSSQTSGTRP